MAQNRCSKKKKTNKPLFGDPAISQADSKASILKWHMSLPLTFHRPQQVTCFPLHFSHLAWSNPAVLNRPPWRLPDESVTDRRRVAKPSQNIHTLGIPSLKGERLEKWEGCKRNLDCANHDRKALGHRWSWLPWSKILILWLIFHVTRGTALSFKGPPSLHQ